MRSRSTRGDLLLLVASLLVVVGSHLAFVISPTQWGGPNIGGGLLLLLGYVGLVTSVRLLLLSHRENKRVTTGHTPLMTHDANPAPQSWGELVGMAVEQAQERIREAGLTARTAGPGQLVTADYRPDRVTLLVVDGRVERATPG